METFTSQDAQRVLEAAGEDAPDATRCRYAQQYFSDIASAYFRERPTPASFTAAIRVADKLSKIAALARSLRGTITYGDATLTKGVRHALARANSQVPNHPEDISKLLTSLQGLEVRASNAYRELRESAKRAYKNDGRHDGTMERLLEGLEVAWSALYGSAPHMMLGTPYARFVKAYVESLATKAPDDEALREFSRKTVSEWTKQYTGARAHEVGVGPA